MAFTKWGQNPGIAGGVQKLYQTPQYQASSAATQAASNAVNYPGGAPSSPSSSYWNTQKELVSSVANRNYDQYITDSNLDLQRTGQELGFSAQGIDPSNPYSRAALLQRQYQQAQDQTARDREQLTYDYGQGTAQVGRNRDELNYQYGQRTGQLDRALQEYMRQQEVGQRGNVTSMSAQGQLYSGALKNAQAETDRVFGEQQGEVGRQRSDAERRYGLDQQTMDRALAELERMKVLGSGAIDRGAENATFGYNAGYDQLRRAYDDFLIQWQRGRRGASNTKADTISMAGLDALAGALR